MPFSIGIWKEGWFGRTVSLQSQTTENMKQKQSFLVNLVDQLFVLRLPEENIYTSLSVDY